MMDSPTVFYETVYADSPEEGLALVEADVQGSTINLCSMPHGKDPYTFVNQLLENADPRVAKGNVGCVNLTESSHNESRSNMWLFFGWEVFDGE